MKIAQVFVEHPIMHLDHTFTYACDGFSVQRGVRVQVPFGKTSIIGFVMQVETITEQQAAGYGFTIRPIDKVIDEEPLLNEELFALGEWMAKNLYRTNDQLLSVHASGKAETKINAWTCKEGSLDTLCERWGWADGKAACRITGTAGRKGNASLTVLSDL